MKQQGISEAELRLGLLKPTLSRYDEVLDSTLLQSVFPDGRVLKIWIVGRQDEVGEVIIKSAAWKVRETK